MTSFIPYRRHHCTDRHRTWDSLKACLWPRAASVSGVGPYAVVSYCGTVTVTLWRDPRSARRALLEIRADECGDACTKRHSLVLLTTELLGRLAGSGDGERVA